MSFIPNTTPTPNWLYNGEMKKMTDTDLRVVLVVTRATLGWISDPKTKMRKEEDWISHSQLIKKTGRSSRAISSAVDSCVKNGWIETRDKKGNMLKTPNERRRKKVFYRLGEIFTNKLSTANSKADKDLPQMTTEPTANSDTNLPQKQRNTKEIITKKTIQNGEQSSPGDVSSDGKNLSHKKVTSSFPFNADTYIQEMRKNEQPYIRLIGWYFQKKRAFFPNSETLQEELRRWINDAKFIASYPVERITQTHKKVSQKFPDDWKLSTIRKYISEK